MKLKIEHALRELHHLVQQNPGVDFYVKLDALAEEQSLTAEDASELLDAYCTQAKLSFRNSFLRAAESTPVTDAANVTDRGLHA